MPMPILSTYRVLESRRGQVACFPSPQRCGKARNLALPSVSSLVVHKRLWTTNELTAWLENHVFPFIHHQGTHYHATCSHHCTKVCHDSFPVCHTDTAGRLWKNVLRSSQLLKKNLQVFKPHFNQRNGGLYKLEISCFPEDNS